MRSIDSALLTQRMQVLVIEDDPDDIVLLARKLCHKNEADFELFQANRLEIGLERLAAGHTDIVLLDLGLPDSQGLAGLDRILAIPHHPPVVVLTGQDNPAMAAEAVKRGAQDFLSKDRITGVELQRVIRHAVERHRSSEQLRLASEQWRITFGAMKDAICLLGPDGRIERCNKAFEELTGNAYGEIIGHHCREVVHGGTTSVEGCPFVKARQTRQRESVSFEARGRHFNAVIDPILDECGNLLGAVHVLTDVTESRQEAQKLRQAIEELRALSSRQDAILATVPEIIAEVDVHKVYVWMNRAGLEFFGEDALGREAASFFDGQQDTYTAVQDVFEGSEEVVRVESWQRRHDGAKRLLAWRCRSLRDGSGRVIGAISAAHDITDRKRGEKVLQARYDLIDFAASHSLEEILVKTLDVVTELTNSAIGFYHFVEKDQNTLSLQAWSTRTAREFCKAQAKGAHYPIADAGVWVDCVRERRPVIHNDYESLPNRKGTPEGHAQVVRELVVPILRESRIVAILGIGNKPHDYTDSDVEQVSYLADVAWEIVERKRAVDVLIESEEKYRALVETTGTGYLILDSQGRVLDANTEYVRLTGRENLDEIVGRSLSEWIAPQAIQKSAEAVARCIKEGRIRNLEIDYLWPDRRIVPIEVNATVRDEGGSLRIVALCRDISDRKRAETELRAHLDEMEQWRRNTVGRELRMIKLKREINSLLQRREEAPRYPEVNQIDSADILPANPETHL